MEIHMPAKATKRKKGKVYHELLDLSDTILLCASQLKEQSRLLLNMMRDHEIGRSFGVPNAAELGDINCQVKWLVRTQNTVIEQLKEIERFQQFISNLKPQESEDDYFDDDE
jgi:hypothetical protein